MKRATATSIGQLSILAHALLDANAGQRRIPQCCVCSWPAQQSCMFVSGQAIAGSGRLRPEAEAEAEAVGAALRC